jgi:hypothetical protein
VASSAASAELEDRGPPLTIRYPNRASFVKFHALHNSVFRNLSLMLKSPIASSFPVHSLPISKIFLSILNYLNDGQV